MNVIAVPSLVSGVPDSQSVSFVNPSHIPVSSTSGPWSGGLTSGPPVQAGLAGSHVDGSAPALDEPTGFQAFVDEVLRDEDDESSASPAVAFQLLTDSRCALHDFSYDEEEDEVLPLTLATLQALAPDQLAELSAFLMGSVKAGTRTGYATACRLWDTYLAEVYSLSVGTVAHPDRFLSNISEDHLCAVILADFVRHLRTLGYRGKAVSKVLSGLRFAFTTSFPFRDRGFDSHLVKTARKACFMSRSELLASFVRAEQIRKAPLPVEFLNTARASHWDGVLAAWDLPGGKGSLRRGSYLGVLLSMNTGLRVGHVAHSNSDDHLILAGDVIFQLRPPASDVSNSPASAWQFAGGGAARQAVLTLYGGLGLDLVGRLSIVESMFYLIPTSKTRGSISQQQSSASVGHTKGALEPFSCDRGTDLSTHLLEGLFEWDLRSHTFPGEQLLSYRYIDVGKHCRTSTKQLQSIPGVTGNAMGRRINTKDIAVLIKGEAAAMGLNPKNFSSKSSRMWLASNSQAMGLTNEERNSIGMWAPGSAVPYNHYTDIPSVAGSFAHITSAVRASLISASDLSLSTVGRQALVATFQDPSTLASASLTPSVKRARRSSVTAVATSVAHPPPPSPPAFAPPPRVSLRDSSLARARTFHPRFGSS